MTQSPVGDLNPATRIVRTVLGDVPTAFLGHIQPHEHVLSDMSGLVDPANPRARDWDEVPASVRRLVDMPVTPATYDEIRRVVLNRDNLQLTSEDDAVAELAGYAALGGGTVVDSTSIGLGRDPEALVRVARRTGVHVVMGSGWYVHPLHPRKVAVTSEEELADEIVGDLTDGVGPQRVRAGLIGEIGLSSPVHPDEAKVLRAASSAQARTGAALQLHPGRAPEAPLEAVRAAVSSGADPTRIVVSHVDRTLWIREQLVELAQTGCYVELDLFGQESSYYTLNPQARRPNDRTRVEWLNALADEGHRDQLLISQDVCQKVYYSQFGGPGYGHILRSVLPLLTSSGWRDADIETLTHHNPARALALATPGEHE